MKIEDVNDSAGVYRKTTRQQRPDGTLVPIVPASSLTQAGMALQGGRIFVKNDADVDNSLIHRILSPLPRLPFYLAILLSKGPLSHQMVGIDPAVGMLPRRCLVLQKDPEWLPSQLPGKWDFAIHVAARTSSVAREFPVYFAIRILQELAHARIAHRDLALHIVHCMLFDLMWNDALSQCRRTMEYELPGERQCLHAALQQARRIFGPRVVNRELARMSLEPGSLFGAAGEIREYASWVAAADSEQENRNIYAETKLLGGQYAHRLVLDWKFGPQALRRVVRRKDLKRILGE